MRRAFGARPHSNEELEQSRQITEFDRTLAVLEQDQIVATGGIFSFEMTLPGGAAIPCGGVTRITVLATHRRRGLLTAMMRRQLHDMRDRGEPLAALYASEAPIYGRFGYGLSTYQAEIEIARGRGAFRNPPPSAGRLSLVDIPRAVAGFAGVWNDVRSRQPGMLSLSDGWWRYELADLEVNREGMSPEYRLLYEIDGKPAGFALYRQKMIWDTGEAAGHLKLRSLIASSPEAYAAVWHYLLNVDLVSRITAEMRPVDEPLRFLLQDERQPKTRLEDGIWLRLVSVADALAARRYAAEERLAFRVHDGFCPWNDGTYELEAGPNGARCDSREGDADLELDVADLAGVYLGGNRFEVLQRAGRVGELRPGAVARADRMFAPDRAPWCPSHF